MQDTGINIPVLAVKDIPNHKIEKKMNLANIFEATDRVKYFNLSVRKTLIGTIKKIISTDGATRAIIHHDNKDYFDVEIGCFALDKAK